MPTAAEDTMNVAALQEVSEHNHAVHAHTGAWVAGVLRSRIWAGRLLPGTKLSEQKLSKALGISRNTLREAFTVLAGESMVQRKPNKGVYVAAPGVKDVQEIYRLWRLMEPAAIQWGQMPPDALGNLETVIAKAKEAKEAGLVEDMANANADLHKGLAALSGSALLSDLMEKALAAMRLVFLTMATTPDAHSQNLEPYIALIAQIKAGKREEAAADFRRYLDTAEHELILKIGTVPVQLESLATVPAAKGGAESLDIS